MKRVVAAIAVVALLTGTTARATGERALGRRFLLEARGALPLIEEPAVTDVVQRLGARLVESLGPQEFDYQFFVVRHPSLNAFAVPGGYVFVFSGLLARAATEDELVGVLGHEIAHVHAHHILRQQAAGQAWTVAGLLGMALMAIHPVLGVGAMAAAQTAQLKFSRDFEQEADFLGVRIAAEAGYDPASLGGFFEHLIAERRLNPTGVPPYMLSHPVSDDRVASVESIIRTQGLKRPAGRPASSLDLREAQAVVRALHGPSDVVIAEYRRRVATTSDAAEARFLLGRVLQTIGKTEAARAELEAAARDAALTARADRPLGSIYLTLGDLDGAERHLARQVARQPGDATARRELGRTFDAKGDRTAALAEFERAVALAPDLGESQRLLGLALGRNGDEAGGLYHLALASRLAGDLPQAYRHFQRVKDLTPEDDRRHAEVEAAMEELQPLVARAERQPLHRVSPIRPSVLRR